MPWDDLHEPGKSGKKGGGSQGGGSQDKPPFDIPQIQIPKFKPSTFWVIAGLLLMVWIIPGTFYFVEPAFQVSFSDRTCKHAKSEKNPAS